MTNSGKSRKTSSPSKARKPNAKSAKPAAKTAGKGKTIAVEKSRYAELTGQMQAINRAMAVIQFDTEGRVLCANDNFLKAMGYQLDEIKGRHHRLFVDAAETESSAYQAFWERLRSGEYVAGQFKRLAKDGHEVWLEASYNPILDASGKVMMVVKYATDVTRKVAKAADDNGQLQAIGRAMAVIEFELDGSIRCANENFLKVMGYAFSEIQGQHHRIFVDKAESASQEYQAFWSRLRAGEYVAGQFKRIAKDGREVWLQASYNAILDASGKVVKVVKYASDVSAGVMQQLATQKTVDDVQAVVEKACMGDLGVRVPEGDKSGNLKVLVQGVNHVLASSGKVLGDIRESLDAIGEGRLTVRIAAAEHQGGFREMVEGVNRALDAVIDPLNVAAQYVDLISKGNIPAPITDSYKGDFNTIKNNLNTCIRVVNALVADAELLSVAAVEGRLATRADASKHEGDFRKIVQGVNDTLDAVIGPLNVAANYVDLISKGDIPAPITDNYNGDFNTIKLNLNRAIEAVNKLVADAELLSVAAVEGRLATRADASKHEGDFRKIVQGVNDTLDAVIGPLNVAANYVDRISKGDIPPAISDNYNGDFNTIKLNLNRAIEAVNKLVADAELLSVAAVEGRLATRADASKHEGDFRKIVQGVNDTLDAVIGPLNVAASYVDQISKGDIPAPITDSYSGDFNTIKNNLNTCIRVVNALVADADMLSQAAVEGRLATRADASKHEGDFRKIVQGVNDTLDAVIGPLNVAANYVDRISKGDIPAPISDSYNGDFNTIKNNLNRAIDAVNRLVGDANLLSQAAVEGRLATRADAGKHEGDFRKIVQGVNDTLDAVIGPLNVAANYVDRISKGDIPPVISDSYNGDFNTIKNNLNRAIEAVNKMVADAQLLSVAAVEGRLATRADAGKHEGDFRKIVQGVNDTLDAVIGPLNVAANYVDRISKGDIPPAISDNYNGDFNTIKLNLNRAIEAVNKLVGDANLLSQAAVEGRLETRADASRHEGDFRKIVQGVNDTLNAVVAPINETGGVLAALAMGDLTQFVESDYRGAFDKMKEDTNHTVRQLGEIVSQIQQATNTINLAAREIAAGNNDLSGRTEQQAASLQETASSMEELTSTVRQNAENARQANQLAVGASDVARKGGQVVGEVVTTMAAINDASKKIVDIISVIDGIAFQTNILALNAAVEAARAGEQGRGFAVVASEVRSLAQRSAAAAKEIKGLIGDSVEKVGAGSKLVEHAGKTMEEIVNSVKRVTDIMTEISAASQEQSQGIEQVNKTVTQMDEVTQQNAALVEQASASARSMEEQAGKLAESVSRFRLEDAVASGPLAGLRSVADLAHRPRPAVKPVPHRQAPSPASKTTAAAAAAAGKDGQWAEF